MWLVFLSLNNAFSLTKHYTAIVNSLNYHIYKLTRKKLNTGTPITQEPKAVIT